MEPLILITGAGGFVGRQLTLDARRRALPFRCASRFPDKLRAPDSVAVPVIDEATDWTDALRDVSVVIHTAGRAHVLKEDLATSLAESRKVNREGALNLARQAAKAGVRKFVFVSSIGVNGAASRRPFTERDVPEPNGAYATSKLEAEEGLKLIAQESGLELVIVRPPLIYGPECPGNFLRLLQLVSTAKVLPLGGIKNKRSFIGLENLSDFLLACAVDARAAGQTFLVADREVVSTTSLVRTLANYLNVSPRLFPVPSAAVRLAAVLTGRTNIYNSLWSDLEIDAKRSSLQLNWTPPVSFDTGIRKTCDWFKRSCS